MATKPATPSDRPNAVSAGYNFQSSWEQNAALPEDHLLTISLISQVAGDRPMPTHVSKSQSVEDEVSAVNEAPPSNGDFGDLVLLNSHQFYKWHTDLETAMKSETDEKYRQYEDELTEHMETCDGVLDQVDSTLSLFNDLQTQHRQVATKTKSLHDACDRLVSEKEKLIEFADALRSKLNYFDELEKIQAKFHDPTMSVSSPHFLPLLKRLDECISYVGSNLQYKDSDVYLKKFRHLQSRALGMVRSHTLSVLKGATQQVQLAIKESNEQAGNVVKGSIPEGAETSLLFVRFKASGGELKSLMEEMEARATRREYAQLLRDCHSVYCEQRLSLVKSIVQQRITEYSKTDSLPSLTRSGCSYLMQVCQLEHQLFDHFFPASAADPSNLAPLIDPLCTLLYDTLRPRYIHCDSLPLLCELVDILGQGGGARGSAGGRRGEAEALQGVRPTMDRALRDVQERITFRAQTFLRDEIANYSAGPTDLDYPGKLEQALAAQQGNSESESDSYSLWYPPLEKTLSCLSKLYRCLDSHIFTGLAQEAIFVCSGSIERASKVISRKASPMDGLLFLVKHLLILREQIAPFDIEFSVTVREMDFSHMLDHVRRILAGQASFFSLTSGASLSRLSPRVTENLVDAKKELEKNLKTTCEQFIMSVTKLTVEPLLSFITKVTAVRVTGALNGRRLREHAFASPEKVSEMMLQFNSALQVALPEVVTKMKVYLHNANTRAILFKPIKSNMAEAHSQVLELIEQEYTEDDMKTIKAMTSEELLAYLDSLA